MTPAQLLSRLIAVGTGLALLAVGFSHSENRETAPPSALGRPAVTALAATNAQTFEKQVLTLVNKARAKKRKCGAKTYAAAKALKWNAKLALAAERHSKDMSVRNYFSHTSKSGKSPYARIKATGYRYRAAAETLAAGYATPSAVVNGWLKSPGHCKIVMSKSYTQVGIGFYSGGGKYRHYTTANFAKPK